MEALAEQINTTRAFAKTAAVNDGNKNDTRYLIKDISFRNNAPFTNCILKINNVLIDNAEVLNVVMSVYILLEYSKNYVKKATGSSRNYYRDEPTIDDDDDDDDDDEITIIQNQNLLTISQVL